MLKKWQARSVLALVALMAGCVGMPASGAVISLTGSLDPLDSNSLFTYEFTLTNSTTLLVQSYGYGGSAGAPGGTNAAGAVIPAGGFDTYLSLFAGTGAGATFVGSNDDAACGPAAPVNGSCLDSRLVGLSLPGGDYTLVLSVAGNISFAENYGSGTLGDGYTNTAFVDFYDPNSGEYRTANWALDLAGYEGTITPIERGGGEVPEPATLALAGFGLLVVAVKRARKFNRTEEQ